MNDTTCPECGEITELAVNKGSGTENTCKSCGATWVSKCATGGHHSLRPGQRFSAAVLASVPTRDILNRITEDWGTLKKFKPELTDFRGTGKHAPHKPALPTGLGQNSPVTPHQPKSAAEAFRLLQAGQAPGAVFSIDGTQAFAVWRAGDKLYNVKVADKQLAATAGVQYSGGNIREHELYQLLNTANKNFKGRITAEVVGKDQDRGAKEVQRAGQKAGSPYWTRTGGRFGQTLSKDRQIHPSSDEFKEQAKRALRQRLEQYKSANAAGVDSPEKMLGFIKQKGFLDKIQVGGYAYDLANTQVDVQDVRRSTAGEPGRWGDSNTTVTYRYSDGNPQSVYSFDRTGGTRPPREFKVVFKAEGGALVPAEIYTEDETAEQRDPATGQYPRKTYRAEVPAESGAVQPQGESLQAQGARLVQAALASICDGGHKPGCECGFCKNKGSFGKKKKDAGKEGESPAPTKEKSAPFMSKE